MCMWTCFLFYVKILEINKQKFNNSWNFSLPGLSLDTRWSLLWSLFTPLDCPCMVCPCLTAAVTGHAPGPALLLTQSPLDVACCFLQSIPSIKACSVFPLHSLRHILVQRHLFQLWGLPLCGWTEQACPMWLIHRYIQATTWGFHMQYITF